MKPRSRYRGLHLFVTVGSTRFDKLVHRMLSDDVVEQLVKLGFKSLVLQIGNSPCDKTRMEALEKEHDIEIEVYDYKASISEDIDKADLVIGHAGAGTCLEVLRKHKRLLIVANDTLMDNHQDELAQQLSDSKYAITTSVEDLCINLETICDQATRLNEFPSADTAKFEAIFDEALKKVNSRL